MMDDAHRAYPDKDCQQINEENRALELEELDNAITYVFKSALQTRDKSAEAFLLNTLQYLQTRRLEMFGAEFWWQWCGKYRLSLAVCDEEYWLLEFDTIEEAKSWRWKYMTAGTESERSVLVKSATVMQRT